MSSSVSVKITLTWSKIMALVILVAASVLTYITKDKDIFMSAIYVVGGLLIGRQGFNALKPQEK